MSAELPPRINPYRMFTGSWLPTWLLERRELSPGAKLTYARLARYAGKRGVAYPRQATLAEEIGVEERRAQRFLLELRKLGLIFVRKSGRGKPARYWFLEHAWITGREFPDTTKSSGQSAPDTTPVSGQSTPALKDRARGLEESHKQKRVTAARGGAATPRTPFRNHRSDHTVSRSPRLQKLVGNLASSLSMKP